MTVAGGTTLIHAQRSELDISILWILTSALYNGGWCAMTTTVETTAFDDLLPRLIDEYALPRDELTPAHPLADKANRLTPAFASVCQRLISVAYQITTNWHVQFHPARAFSLRSRKTCDSSPSRSALRRLNCAFVASTTRQPKPTRSARLADRFAMQWRVSTGA